MIYCTSFKTMAIFDFFGKILDSNEREIKKYLPLVEFVSAFENDVKKLSDKKLREQTEEFRKRLRNGETLEDVLPEAFFTVR